jgi:LPS O-antigen subunit length determinant protein (WzzB/FepE family)
MPPWNVARPVPNPHILAMTPFSDSDEAKARRATLLARKISQADEGRAAMDDYHRSHQATLDRTARLRALRLAQQTVPVEAKPTTPKKPTKPKRKAKVA